MQRPEHDVGAVVALKSWDRAKSRLQDARDPLPDPLRRRLAQTMAADTLIALAGAVGTVLVISDEPSLQGWLAAEGVPAVVATEPAQAGMNPALRHGDRLLRDAGTRLVLACVADLPGLRAEAVTMIVAAGRGSPRGFLADADGTGTTMLIADGVPLDPRFEGASAAAHRSSGAVPLAAGLGEGELITAARRDVDTVSDLYAVGGLGPQTAALIDPDTGRLGRHQVITTTNRDQVITATGHRIAFDHGARWRSGQRLHACTGADRVLSAWI